MKPIPNESDLKLYLKQLKVEVAGEQDDMRIAERHAAERDRHAAAANAARESAQSRRLRIGAILVKARIAWPKAGPKARGWGDYLREAGISEDSALRYMAEARGEFPQPTDCGNSQGDDRDPKPSNVHGDGDPDPEDADEPEDDIDRDTWCTPQWLVDPIGSFDLDPCGNERSTVHAAAAFDLERRGEDGLGKSISVPASARVFINPPYSTVPPWISAYKHTGFCFLLKLDTSTKWFAELHAATQLILIPRRRVNFTPPPGVPPKKAIAQQFPHALFYAHDEDATAAIRALSWSWRVDLSRESAQPNPAALHIVRP